MASQVFTPFGGWRLRSAITIFPVLLKVLVRSLFVRSLLYLAPERGEGGKALEDVPKRIGRDDGDDLSDVWVESEKVLFADELKLSFWTMPHAMAS
jgi:hypothetical protein